MSLSHVVKGFEVGYELQNDIKPVMVCAVNDTPTRHVPDRSHVKHSLPPIAPSLPSQPISNTVISNTGSGKANVKSLQKFQSTGSTRELNPGKAALTQSHKPTDRAPLRSNSDTCVPDLTLKIQRCSLHAQEEQDSPESDPDEFFDRQVTKDIPAHLLGEWRSLAESIRASILTRNPDVRWDTIVGLLGAKCLLQEAVVQPVKYPNLFTGILAPWRGVLLFGPPGTGKTLLAKAVATECKTTFYNISASMVISKWRGDSEKLIRTLFDMARHHAPSTIFIDEIDALCSARGGEGEHEASRRMKTELLTQMDGLARTNEHVFVLAATNLPWELDLALLRRLEKRILVGLPCVEDRACMLQRALHDRAASDIDFNGTAKMMTMYSGSDVMQVAKEAAMRPLRRMVSALECGDTECSMGPVSHADLRAAFAVVQGTAGACDTKHQEFAAKFGSRASD
eukprot:jgi/Ulvmu1/4058/UM019_0035.1